MPVYIIRAGQDGPVKIGSSMYQSLPSRLQAIQSCNHVQLYVLRIFEDDPFGLERILHFRFKAQRLHGEWFAYHPDMEGELGAKLCNDYSHLVAVPLPGTNAWTPERRAARGALTRRLHAERQQSAA